MKESASAQHLPIAQSFPIGDNICAINILKRRRECGTYLATACRHLRRLKMQKRDEEDALQLMKAAVPAESYVIHLSSASLVS